MLFFFCTSIYKRVTLILRIEFFRIKVSIQKKKSNYLLDSPPTRIPRKAQKKPEVKPETKLQQ